MAGARRVNIMSFQIASPFKYTVAKLARIYLSNSGFEVLFFSYDKFTRIHLSCIISSHTP